MYFILSSLVITTTLNMLQYCQFYAKSIPNKCQIIANNIQASETANLRKRSVNHPQRVQDHEPLHRMADGLRHPGFTVNHDHQDL